MLQITMSLSILKFRITFGTADHCRRSICSLGLLCMKEYSLVRIWKKEGSLAHFVVPYVLRPLKISATYF